MIKVEEGKFYRTADGQKVGPMRRWKGSNKFECAKDDNRLWDLDGSRDEPGQGESIIAEWVDEAATRGTTASHAAASLIVAAIDATITKSRDDREGCIASPREVEAADILIINGVVVRDRTPGGRDEFVGVIPRVPRISPVGWLDLEQLSPGPVSIVHGPASEGMSGMQTVAIESLGTHLVAADLLAAIKRHVSRYGRLYDGSMTPRPPEDQTLGIADLMKVVEDAEGRGIRAQSFAERERDLLEANNRYLEEARTARRMMEVMTEQSRRRGITILGMSEFGGAHLSRAEKAEREVKELRHAIMAGEPAPEFADTIGHGNYLEMARTLHDAVAGGQESIKALTAERDQWRSAAEAETRKVDDLRNTVQAASAQRDRWFACHTAHQEACTALGKANGELLKRCVDAEDRYSDAYNSLRAILPLAESRAEDMQESDAENLPEFEESPETVKAVAAVDTAKRLLGII